MTSEQLPLGYIYRVAKASAEQLQAIITTHVGAGSTFGGAAEWDFESKRGRDNLRPIKQFADAAAIDVRGDFGHAFNADTEVRWKRRDGGQYDVLILSEKPQAVDKAQSLRWWNSAQDVWEDYVWRTRRYEKAAIIQADNYPAIRYIDYLAPNGAVQFQQLVEEA